MMKEEWTEINEELHRLREENDKLRGWLETETMNREEFKKLCAENERLKAMVEHYGSHAQEVRDYLRTLSPPSEAGQQQTEGTTKQ